MRLLLTTALLTTLAMPSQAQLYNHAPSEDNPIEPRVELNHRYSNDRAISMMEFWVPLGQNEADGSVLFGDLRMMGDNIENRELNVGIGYREIVETKLLGEGIIGGMVWFDRRLTSVGSKFNQVTTGLEWLAEDYDIRLNGYVPLNKDKRYTQANPNGNGLGFVGNQIIVNTDQSLVEEALPGLDLEVGYKLDFMDGVTDATRVYAGAYHFEGDYAEDVTGWRARISSDITEDVQIGARFQKDDLRGSQAYAEATIRLPFGAKRSFQEEGLRARLDESPERDIDIVAATAVINDGINAKILNATTGVAQNVLHVDNTAGGGGDGSAENPFNTLVAAETAAVANDLIYVHRGDGTTTGQDAGITLDDDGQMLVGSGADLKYNQGRYRASNGLNINGGVIVAKQTANNPIITNGAGSGVNVTADNVFLSGFTVDGATSFGVTILEADNGVIEDISAINNTLNGVLFRNDNGGTINSFTSNNSILSGNNSGLSVSIANAGVVENININNNIIENNINDGLRVNVDTNGSLGALVVKDSIADNNDDDGGFVVSAQTGGNIDAITFENNISRNHTISGYGFNVFSFDAGSSINKVSFENNLSENNEQSGFRVYARTNGAIDDVSLINNKAINNNDHGIATRTTTSGTITNTIIDSNELDGNIMGIYVDADFNSTVTNTVVKNNVSSNNSNSGIRVETDNGSAVSNVLVEDNVVQNSGVHNFLLFSKDTATLSDVVLKGNLSDGSLGQGFSFLDDDGGIANNVTYENNISVNNNLSGFLTTVNNVSDLDNVVFKGNTSQNNTDGFTLSSDNDADVDMVVVERNNFTNNTSRGVVIRDDSALHSLDVDFGGGASGSSGGNNIASNPTENILVDLDGDALKAENNYWGSASGLQPADFTLQDGSTIDADPFLTVAP